jgi:hypothetical protein
VHSGNFSAEVQRRDSAPGAFTAWDEGNIRYLFAYANIKKTSSDEIDAQLVRRQEREIDNIGNALHAWLVTMFRGNPGAGSEV